MFGIAGIRLTVDTETLSLIWFNLSFYKNDLSVWGSVRQTGIREN